jgi:hypothetical protein
MVLDEYRPLCPVLKDKVPVTLADPLPDAVHVTVQLPFAARPVELSGL